MPAAHPFSFCAVLFCLCATAPASCLAANPPSYSVNLPENTFEKPKGDWLKPANWQLGHVPADNEWAMIGHNTAVSLSQKAPFVHSLNIGGRTLSSLTLEKDASLSVAVLRIRSHVNGAVGLLELTGGSLILSKNDQKNITGGVFIGDSPTYSSTGVLRISGGRFEGRGLSVGTSIQDRGVATLSVIGSKASIETAKDHTGARMVVFGGSTLEFVLDADGVSPVDYSRTGALLKSGALVRVDGAKYAGKKTTLPLVLGRTADEGARFECVGFPPRAAGPHRRRKNGHFPQTCPLISPTARKKSRLVTKAAFLRAHDYFASVATGALSGCPAVTNPVCLNQRSHSATQGKR